MISILGFDIGGANIKASYIIFDDNSGKITSTQVLTYYFPIWRRGKEKLGDAIRKVKDKVCSYNPSLIAITMTAELSDVYFSKREGVLHIISTIENIFPKENIVLLTVDGKLIATDEAIKNPLEVAAANWYATGWLASKLSENCLVLDTGSTTTSIIPVLNGRVAAKGKNDLEKLMLGELVYTGVLRTNIPAITHYLPYRNTMVPVSSEYFAQSGDVHIILGNITEEQYTVDTPDGRGCSHIEAAARLARVICADLDLVTMDEIHEIAKYIYEKQVKQIIEGLERLFKNHNVNFRLYPAYVTGLGGEFLAKVALGKFGFKDIRRLSDYIGFEAAKATPAYAVALMGLEYLIGEVKMWI